MLLLKSNHLISCMQQVIVYVIYNLRGLSYLHQKIPENEHNHNKSNLEGLYGVSFKTLQNITKYKLM